MDILLITLACLVFHISFNFSRLLVFYFTDNHLNLFFAADFYHDDTKFNNIGIVIILPRNADTKGVGDKLGKMSLWPGKILQRKYEYKKSLL